MSSEPRTTRCSRCARSSWPTGGAATAARRWWGSSRRQPPAWSRGGERRALEARLGPGAFRLRSPQSRSTAVIELRQEPAPTTDGVVALTVTPAAILPPLTAGSAGRVRLEVENRTTVPSLVVLDEPG